MSFAETHGIWSDEQARASADVAKRVDGGEVDVIRFSFADQHGILRGKTLIAADAIGAMRGGCTITSTLLLKDPSHRTTFPVFTAGAGTGMAELQGGADVVMVPDPTTFRILPWA